MSGTRSRGGTEITFGSCAGTCLQVRYLEGLEFDSCAGICLQVGYLEGLDRTAGTCLQVGYLEGSDRGQLRFIRSTSPISDRR